MAIIFIIMNPFSLNVIEEKQSALKIASLISTKPGHLSSDKDFAQLIWQVISKISGEPGIILIWYACEEPGPFPKIPKAIRLQQPADHKGEMEPVYWKHYDDIATWSSDFSNIWNAYGSAQAYPAKNKEAIDSYITTHFFDRSSEKAFDMDDQTLSELENSDDIPSMIGKALQSSFDKIEEVFSDKEAFENLINPFKNKKDLKLLNKINLYAYKNGHDDDSWLEIITSHPDVTNIFENVLKKNQIKYNLIENQWSPYPEQDKEQL